MINTLEELEKTLMRERSAQAARDFRSAVRPIYAVSTSRGPNPEFKHAGSSILLRIDGHAVLSTAAHILDERSRGVSLFVGGPVGTKPLPIQGGVLRTTTPPQGDRDLDHYDGGFWKIPEDTVPALGAVEFLDDSRLSRNLAPTDRRYYMAMGYPLSRNKGKIDKRTKSIGNRLARYTGSVVELPKLAAVLGVSGAEHLFLHFEKRAQSEDDTEVNAYDPTGLSGGPLLDLGDFTLEQAYSSDRTHRATLSGMLIEHHPDHRAMVAVKIGPIVQGIRRSLARS